MRESELERHFCREVREGGGMPLKFVSPNCRGVPDRLILMPGGNAVFAEIKKPGEKLRPLQVYRKGQLERYGFVVWVIDSVEAVSDFCATYFPSA